MFFFLMCVDNINVLYTSRINKHLNCRNLKRFLFVFVIYIYIIAVVIKPRAYTSGTSIILINHNLNCIQGLIKICQ